MGIQQALPTLSLGPISGHTGFLQGPQATFGRLPASPVEEDRTGDGPRSPPSVLLGPEMGGDTRGSLQAILAARSDAAATKLMSLISQPASRGEVFVGTRWSADK